MLHETFWTGMQKKIKEEGYAEPNQLDHKYQPTATI